MDLFFRKILRNEGKALRALLGQITAFAAGEEGNGRLKPERTALARAAGDVEGLVSVLAGYAASSLERPGGDLPGRAEHHPAADGPG